MTRKEFLRSYWDYYIILENDFIDTERYVSFDLGDNYMCDNPNDNTIPVKNAANSLCFSNEFIKQFQTICSEIDVIMKSICKELNENSRADNIVAYTEEILKKWPQIVDQKVSFQQLQLQPFLNWKFFGWEKDPKCNSPDWWIHHNKVKHQRLDYYKKANLKNTVNSLAALYILERYFVKYIGDRDQTAEDDQGYDVPDSSSKIFGMIDFKTREQAASSFTLYLSTKEDIDSIT